MIDSPLARFPFFGALAAGVAAVTLGLAEHAIDELRALKEKKSMGSSRSLAERAPVQADLALAIANTGQARSYLHECAEQAWAVAESGRDVTDDARAALRLAATACACEPWKPSISVITRPADPPSTARSALQRIFRDAHVAISHGMITRRTLEPIGRRRIRPADVHPAVLEESS